MKEEFRFNWIDMNLIDRTIWLQENCPPRNISRKSSKLVCGVGINDANYAVQPMIGGAQVKCPAYVAWKAMLVRSYNKKSLLASPTYEGVRVCEEWHSFMSFRKWWMSNQVEGWELDKDLLSDDRVYSPDNCIFIPAHINTFTSNSPAARGNLPIGVSYHAKTGKYQCNCQNPFTRSQEYLGLFSDPMSAHSAWLERKLEIANELKSEMDDIDERLYDRVISIIVSLK